jgi:hypothetical protein
MQPDDGPAPLRIDVHRLEQGQNVRFDGEAPSLAALGVGNTLERLIVGSRHAQGAVFEVEVS